MDTHSNSISFNELTDLLSGGQPPLLIDVRREATFLCADRMARVNDWAPALPRAAPIVVMCAHGLEVGADTVQALRLLGFNARYLQGGLQAWQESNGALTVKPTDAPTRWITRARPKIDRIACPWFVRRFVDSHAQFLYVPASEVRSSALAESAIPYDVAPAVAETVFSHIHDACSFDAFVTHYRMTHDPALRDLANIVRGADTGQLGLAPQSAGLLAITLGLSGLYADDHAMLEHGMVIYDALYHWCKEGQAESHTWNPKAA
jgi:rhodanese-related sulfurtransferase